MSDGAAIDLTWGDLVMVDPSAESRFRPTAKAWVVGLPGAGALLPGQRVTIEYEDGSDVELPAELLHLVARPGH